MGYANVFLSSNLGRISRASYLVFQQRCVQQQGSDSGGQRRSGGGSISQDAMLGSGVQHEPAHSYVAGAQAVQHHSSVLEIPGNSGDEYYTVLNSSQWPLDLFSYV